MTVGHRLSENLIQAVLLTERRQDWMREYLISCGHDPLEFVGSAYMRGDPISLINDITGALHLERGWQSGFSTWANILKFLRERAEDIDFLVMSDNYIQGRELDTDEFFGFALVDKYAPLIFLNSNVPESIQVFTLVRGVIHTWLGNGAIFKPNELASDTLLCSYIAKRILALPVSPWQLPEKTDAREEDFFELQERRLGSRFLTAIAQSTLSGSTLYRNAYRLTGLYGDAFQEIADGKI